MHLVGVDGYIGGLLMVEYWWRTGDWGVPRRRCLDVCMIAGLGSIVLGRFLGGERIEAGQRVRCCRAGQCWEWMNERETVCE